VTASDTTPQKVDFEGNGFTRAPSREDGA
jgi:hypothetical protein